MKVSVTQQALAYGLSLVIRAVPPKSTLPVLGNILLSTDNGRLKLCATDLSMGVTAWIGAKIEGEGAVTLPARTLTDLVSTLPADMVNMSLNERMQSIDLVCGKSKTSIKGIDAHEFPPMPFPDLESGIIVNGKALAEMIAQVAFSASDDTARPVLTGVQVVLENGKLTMAAADGFRPGFNSMVIPDNTAKANMIVPASALKEVARIAGDEAVTLCPGNGSVVFHLASAEIASQLIEGNYPDIFQIVPKAHKNRAIVGVAALAKAVRQAEIFARQGAGIAKLKIGAGKVEVTGESDETGQNVADVEADTTGDEIEIAFNVRFLREALDAMRAAQVIIETSTPVTPGVFKTQDDDSSFRHVIMPMHLSGG